MAKQTFQQSYEHLIEVARRMNKGHAFDNTWVGLHGVHLLVSVALDQLERACNTALKDFRITPVARPVLSTWCKTNDLVLEGVTSRDNTDRVYWSPQGHTYVIVPDMGVTRDLRAWMLNRQPVLLLSINGHGEVRWAVDPQSESTAGDHLAAQYFGLTKPEA